MEGINPVSTTDGDFTRIAGGAAAKNEDMMGRDAFLKLLVTQMKYQDPLSPMKNTEFTAQLAQFSSLDQLYAVNKNLLGLQGIQDLYLNSSLTGILGKEIIAGGNSIELTQEGSEVIFSLSEDAAEVIIDIVGPSGNVVRKIFESELSSGMNSIKWDGLDGNSSSLSSGTYSFYVSAFNAAGDPVNSTTMLKGVADGISFRDGRQYVQIGDIEVEFGKVVEINN